MRQLLFIYGFLLVCIVQAQRINFDAGDVVYNPSQSSNKHSFVSFSVVDVQSKITSSERNFRLYSQYEIGKYNSTVGMSVTKNTYSTFLTNDIQLLYAYTIKIDTNSFFSFGLKSGLTFAKLSNHLVFEDQLSVYETTLRETQEVVSSVRKSSFTSDAGVTYKRAGFDVGLSVLNLVKPQWNFSTANISQPTLINASIRQVFVMNRSRTLRMVPMVLTQFSDSGMRLGGNTKIEFSGYEGFEGKVYTGLEYFNSSNVSSVNSWQLFFGYEQDRLLFQYGYGSVVQYNQQLGASNSLMVSYMF